MSRTTTKQEVSPEHSLGFETKSLERPLINVTKKEDQELIFEELLF